MMGHDGVIDVAVLQGVGC